MNKLGMRKSLMAEKQEKFHTSDLPDKMNI